MIIKTLRYKSGLSHDEIDRHFRERSERYRAVPGLIQKYYVKFPDTEEYGGICMWDSQDSLDSWRAGNLSGTLAKTYKVEGEPSREFAEVMLVLHGD